MPPSSRVGDHARWNRRSARLRLLARRSSGVAVCWVREVGQAGPSRSTGPVQPPVSRRDIQVAAPQGTLHVDRVEPAAELDARRMQGADRLETEARVNAN